MLCEASDRTTAQRGLEEQLQEVRQVLQRAYKELDVISCQCRFIEEIGVRVPVLKRALDIYSDQIAQYETLIEEQTNAQDLLKERLLQSRQQSCKLFHLIHTAADAFLLSMEKKRKLARSVVGTSKDAVIVPTQLSSSLRVMTDCYIQRVQPASQRLKQIRREVLELSKTIEETSLPAQRGDAKAKRRQMFRSLRRQENKYEIQRSQQDQQERQFLDDHARPFLIECKKMPPADIRSETSSTFELAQIEGRPKEHWSGLQVLSNIPNHRIWPDTEKVADLRHARRELHGQRSGTEEERRQYAIALAGFLYMNRACSKEDFDATWAQNTGIAYDVHMKAMENHLVACQNQYDEELNSASSDEKNGLVQADWAATRVDDDQPDESPTTKHHLSSPQKRKRSKAVTKYGRDVARRKPSWISPSIGPSASPNSKNPLSAMADDVYRVEDDASEDMDQENRAKRVKRMEAVAQELRKQFEQDYGMKYVQSPLMAFQ